MALVVAASVQGCAAPRPVEPSAMEFRDASGFTITEQVSIDDAARADFDRALAALDRERFEEGIRLLESVAGRAPGVTSVHINLGVAYSRTGNLEAAEASLDRALALNPRHPVAHNELGMVYRRTGRFEEARASYEAALATHPEFHFARRNLAVLCDMYLADLECAMDNYERYSQAVPSDEEAAMWIADLKNRAGWEGTP
jgi:Flp pilus assembly protein TadD